MAKPPSSPVNRGNKGRSTVRSGRLAPAADVPGDREEAKSRWARIAAAVEREISFVEASAAGEDWNLKRLEIISKILRTFPAGPENEPGNEINLENISTDDLLEGNY